VFIWYFSGSKISNLSALDVSEYTKNPWVVIYSSTYLIANKIVNPKAILAYLELNNADFFISIGQENREPINGQAQ
jgi:hypothetical protein